MEPPVFQPSVPFTIGVELELELLDKTSLNLSPQAPALLAAVPVELRDRIKPEFIQSMVEICTPVCRNMKEMEQELLSLCRIIHRLAETFGCLIHAASLHPFARTSDRHVSAGVRYGEIMDDLQLAGRRMITQALHVHVGLPDANTAIQVCDRIRSYLPLLLSLTTSSPFFEGEDTGFFSYRTNLFKSLPRSGIPETLGSWEKFQDLLLILNEATLLNGIKELWWDVRPHPDFGTVEVRLCDLPSRFDEILAMTALIQALAATLAEQPVSEFPHREIMLHNKWHASRHGLAGTCISPQHGNHKSFADTIPDLLDFIRPAARNLNSIKYLAPILRIARQGSSAHQQKRIYAETGDFLAVIDRVRREFWS